MLYDLGTITDTKLEGVLIIARVDKTYVLINDDGSGTPASSGNMVLDGAKNEACYINLAGGLDSGNYIRLLGDAETSAIEYFAFGT